ncbi:MAG: type II toxin-antitoxin system RelE/ParE family toxin [Zymomonas sp.]|nr:MAG: type II toxin-antitoxin system RelE/ParE family toxin [Zymomonas sp.]
MRVSLSEEAKRDLGDIGDYIALDDPDRAESFVVELTSKASELASMPNRFPLLPRFASAGIRHRTHGAYLILYAVRDEEVYVLRFIHGARDYQALLLA